MPGVIRCSSILSPPGALSSTAGRPVRCQSLISSVPSDTWLFSLLVRRAALSSAWKCWCSEGLLWSREPTKSAVGAQGGSIQTKKWVFRSFMSLV